MLLFVQRRPRICSLKTRLIEDALKSHMTRGHKELLEIGGLSIPSGQLKETEEAREAREAHGMRWS